MGLRSTRSFLFAALVSGCGMVDYVAIRSFTSYSYLGTQIGGGAGVVNLYAYRATTDGDLYVAGRGSYDIGGTLTGPLNTGTLAVVKMNSSSSGAQWIYRWGDNDGNLIPNDLVATSNGIVIHGTYQAPLNNGQSLGGTVVGGVDLGAHMGIGMTSSGVPSWVAQQGRGGFNHNFNNTNFYGSPLTSSGDSIHLVMGIASFSATNAYGILTGNTFGLVKFSSAGAIDWSTQVGETVVGALMVSGAAYRTSSGDIIAITTQNNGVGVDFGGTVMGSVGGVSCGYVAHFAKDTGVRNWHVQVSNAGSTVALTPAGSPGTLDSSGNVFLGGYTSGSFGGIQVGTQGTQDVFIAKIDSTGTPLFIMQHGVAGATSTPDNHLNHSGGSTYQPGRTTGVLANAQLYGTHGTWDGFLGRYNSTTGAHQNSVQIAAGAATTTTMLLPPEAFFSNGDILTYGTSSGTITSATLSGTHGTSDIYLARFTSDLTPRWISQIAGGAGTTTTARRVYLKNGRVLVCGTATGLLDTVLVGTHGNTDVYFLELDPSTGSILYGRQFGGGLGKTVSLTSCELGNSQIHLFGGTGGGIFSFATQLGTGLGTSDFYRITLSPFGGF